MTNCFWEKIRTMFYRKALQNRQVLTLAALCLLSIIAHSVESFRSTQCSWQCSTSIGKRRLSFSLFSTAECETGDKTSTANTEPIQQHRWLDKGLLLSSFSDGLKSNPPAVDWLMNALVETLWKEEQCKTQLALKESNLASPCNGPDPVLLEQLEDTDRLVEGMQGSATNLEDWRTKLELLCRKRQTETVEISERADSASNTSIDLRVLYIPTAMYALRSDSTSTPGKQRQRNRADGKKRRNQILQLLEDQLQGFCADNEDVSFALQAVTMDLDDASVKQPEEVVVGQIESFTSSARFPETGKEAIRDWKPHLVYVQGGNTFWLHHCMEKGDWTQDLMKLCGCDSGSDADESSFAAIYCGVSAGAILAGESMQTACWKEWDDPSVVPGKETYGDWKDASGLCAVGSASVFPHMADEWTDLADRKTKELLEYTSASSSGGTASPPTVFCIRDDQAYAVDGRRKSITKL